MFKNLIRGPQWPNFLIEIKALNILTQLTLQIGSEQVLADTYQMAECMTQSDPRFQTQIWTGKWLWKLMRLETFKTCCMIFNSKQISIYNNNNWLLENYFENSVSDQVYADEGLFDFFSCKRTLTKLRFYYWLLID